MDNNKFDYLIPEISKMVSQYFFNTLSTKKEFQEVIDTSPLVNMTLGVFVSCLINSLDEIKKYSIGEVKLMENIELAKNTILKAIEDLPFVAKVEFT